jgi:hypothetical protein
MPDTTDPREPEETRENSENVEQRSEVNEQGEKVGDILRKERVTRRITIETIAKDLKLNVNYIKALESSDFAKLPPEPYIRVYLRSLATYLMLEPEEILRKFYQERGVTPTTYEEERATKINVAVKDKEKNHVSWVLLLAIVAILAALGYVANKKGWITSPGRPKQPVQQSIQKEEAEQTDTTQKEPEDTLGQQQEQEAGEEEILESSEASPAEADTMRLLLSAMTDSVWVQIFSDGESWRNFIYPGRPRLFTAQDSFNVHVGNNDLMQYRLNGKKIKVKDEGIATFKVDSSGVKIWGTSKWNRTFKNRID